MGTNGRERDRSYLSVVRKPIGPETAMDDDKTWRWDSGGLVGWNYRPMARSDGRLVPLDLEESETRRRWLCELVGRLSALLGDFAYPTEVYVSSREKGENAGVIDW